MSPRGRWITPDEFERMVDMYGQGMSIRSISRATGRSYGGVWRALYAARVQFRPRGGDWRRHRQVAEETGTAAERGDE